VTKDKMDEEVVQEGVRIIIDKKAQLSLLGTEMDYVQSKLSAEFVFNNPNVRTISLQKNMLKLLNDFKLLDKRNVWVRRKLQYLKSVQKFKILD
jgi:hypothetical protein